MKISHPRPGTLELTKSRLRATLNVAFTILFHLAWYSVLIYQHFSEQGPLNLFMLLFWIAPLWGIPEFFRQLRVVMSGETFVLSRDLGTIERNGTRVAHFTDVARVQIRSISIDEGEEYRLSIVLNSDEKLRLDQSSDGNEITDLAEDVADVLGVEVTRKG